MKHAFSDTGHGLSPPILMPLLVFLSSAFTCRCVCVCVCVYNNMFSFGSICDTIIFLRSWIDLPRVCMYTLCVHLFVNLYVYIIYVVHCIAFFFVFWFGYRCLYPICKMCSILYGTGWELNRNRVLVHDVFSWMAWQQTWNIERQQKKVYCTPIHVHTRVCVSISVI